MDFTKIKQNGEKSMLFYVKINEKEIGVSITEWRYDMELSDEDTLEACRQIIDKLTGVISQCGSEPFNQIKGLNKGE